MDNGWGGTGWLVALAAGLALTAAACGRSTASESAAAGSASPSGSADPASASAAATGPLATAAGAVPEGPPKADPTRLQLRGKAIQGGLLLATVDPGTRKLSFPGHRAVISPQGEFLIAFYRNAPPREVLTVTFPDESVLEHAFDVEQRQYPDDVITGLPDSQVALDPETRKLLHQSNERIEAVRNRYTKTPYYQGGFVWPVTGRVTSRYGQERILNGVKSGPHWGVDIAVPLGTPVKAPAGGTVAFVGKDVPLSGNVLILDHGHGLSSTFLHLGSFAVAEGKEVRPGEVIATVGTTGRSTGPHLDWRINFFKIRLDPELLVEQDAWKASPESDDPAPTASAAAAASAAR